MWLVMKRRASSSHKHSHVQTPVAVQSDVAKETKNSLKGNTIVWQGVFNAVVFLTGY